MKLGFVMEGFGEEIRVRKEGKIVDAGCGRN